jgi:preprotein translocase SecE subunit
MEENQRYVTGSLLLFGLLLWFVLTKALMPFESLLGDLLLRFGVGFGFGASAPTMIVRVVAFLVTLFTIVILRRDPRVNGFLLEVVMELRKVTWSSLKETWASTLVVIIGVAIMSIILATFDIIWSWISTWVLT